MTTADFKNPTTIESIKSSIDTDTHVYRWFLNLILQPSVRQQFDGIDGPEQTYATLRAVMRVQGTVAGLFLLIMLLGYFLKDPAYFWVSAFLMYPIFRLHMKKKHCVISITERLFETDPEKTLLMKQTLYKTCEQYSRKHKVPSMVDYICFSNRILRWTLLIGFVLTIVVLPFRGIENGIAFLLVYLAVYAFVNSTAVHKVIK